MKTPFKDRFGVDIFIGDIIVYSTNYSGMGLRKVVGVSPSGLKLRVKDREDSRPTYINAPEDSIVLTNTGTPEDLWEQQQKQ